MKSGKYSWLKKHPIVLFLRRLYRRLFKTRQNFVRFNPDHHLITTGQNNIEEVAAEEYDDRLATIGQLFEEVNWNNYPVMVSEKRPKVKRVARTISATPDSGSFSTVGELLQQVKWRVPPKVIQEQFLSNNKNPPGYDVSLN